jgi:hypothetical protein
MKIHLAGKPITSLQYPDMQSTVDATYYMYPKFEQ